MSEEANVALVHRNHQEVFEQGLLDAVDEIFTPEFVDHTPNIPEEWRYGPAGIKHQARALRVAFPDLQVVSEDAFAVADRVVNRWTLRGTHQGDLLGLPATGKQVAVTGIEVFRIADGKLAEAWANYDELGLMQQLGVLPAPEAVS